MNTEAKTEARLTLTSAIRHQCFRTQQAASSNQQTKVHPSGANYMVLRPVKKNNKNIRDEKIHNKASSNSRVQQSLTELRPPPQIKNHLRVTKVI